MTKRSVARNPVAAPSALDELLDAERQIAARNADVARECAAMLDRARVDASAIAAAATAALDAEILQLDERTRRERDALVAGIEAEAARTIAHYEHLADAEVTRLAELIATRVTGLSPVGADGAAT